MSRCVHLAFVVVVSAVLLSQASCASYALERAVYAQDVQGAQRALANGANPDHRAGTWDMGTALLYMDTHYVYRKSAILVEAVKTGHVDITKALLEAGADTRLTDLYDQTALLVAAVQWPNGADLVRLLLAHGADPTVKSGYPSTTPLAHALHSGCLATALLLYPVSPKPEFPDYGLVGIKRGDFGTLVVAVVHMFDRNELPASEEGLADFPALTRAILLGRIDQLQRLLAEHREDLEQRDRYKFTPLMWAASRFGSTEMTRLLLDAGADASAQGDGRWTELYSAVEAGNAEVIRLLSAAGADPNVINSYVEGRLTLLISAAQRRRADVVRALLDAGADPTVALDNGAVTPLSVAKYNESDDRQTIEAMLREAMGISDQEQPAPSSESGS